MFYIAQILNSVFDYHILEIEVRSVQISFLEAGKTFNEIFCGTLDTNGATVFHLFIYFLMSYLMK